MPPPLQFTSWQYAADIFFNYKFEPKLSIFYSILFYLASPQGQGHYNNVSQLLWARITQPPLSTFPVGGNWSTRRKPTTFGRALTILFLHEDRVQVHIKMNLPGIKLGTLEVTGEWSDHYTTEAFYRDHYITEALFILRKS